MRAASESSVPLGRVCRRVSSLAPPSPVVDGPAVTLALQTDVVLHFDVNETILVGDEAGGDTVEECLHKILAKSAFVQVPIDKTNESFEDTSQMEPTHWWNGTPILLNRQEYHEHNDRQVQDNASNNLLVPPLYTGWTWPANCVPYYRTKLRRTLGKDFCHHNGAIYQETFAALREKMLPPPAGSPTFVNKLLPHLIPALFETLVQLSTFSNKEHRWTLVFRTFGSDLPDLAQAITAFARGQHPRYPNFADERLVLTQEQLLRGKWVEPEAGEASHSCSYQLWDYAGEALVASGDAAILEYLHDPSRRICGIVDDYAFWSRHECQPWAGKPVWKTQSFHHILFDDNIHNLQTDSIASVRAENGGGRFASLSGQEMQAQQGIHLVRVPTVEPLFRPTWFLEQIQLAQENYVKQQQAPLQD